jgi:YidC/Oxa1 family membrane protein insertase
MAKTRVLKPEIDEIKERVGDDMLALQQEQMALYQKVGVNPLSGCIPVLAQMPILLAMFNFFPNLIDLRQKGFLWADDLSSYDTIYPLRYLSTATM